MNNTLTCTLADVITIILMILLLYIIFNRRQNFYGGNRLDIGDPGVYPNRFDSTPYGIYPFQDYKYD